VHPIVGVNDDITIIKTKYTFGAQAWNAATMREKSEELYQLAKKDVSAIMPGSTEITQLFEEMVKRKQKEFSAFKNIIADFEIKKIRGFDYDLTVATIPLKDL
jgi:16S rRNA C1402 N4-methylase RsmH